MKIKNKSVFIVQLICILSFSNTLPIFSQTAVYRFFNPNNSAYYSTILGDQTGPNINNVGLIFQVEQGAAGGASNKLNAMRITRYGNVYIGGNLLADDISNEQNLGYQRKLTVTGDAPNYIGIRLDNGKFSMGGVSDFEIDANGVAGGRFKILTNGQVNIGDMSTPGGLQIFRGSTNNPSLILNSSGPGWGSGMYFVNSAPSGKNYGIYSGGDGRFHFGNVNTGVDNLVLDQSGNVGIGATMSTNPNNYKLAVNGKIGAKEIIVETTSSTWADYVFENNYNLRPLSQVESFIKENKHLPEIPSAKEIEANGINLGEMDALLLKKIEELTLYVIELKKEDDRIKKENGEIKRDNQSMKLEIQQLKTK